MVDRAAAAHAALPTPLEMALPAQPRGPLIADATTPLFTFLEGDFYEHNEYVTAALLRRLRGLPIGRRWPAIEKLGAPLAALAGFRGRGEPGLPPPLALAQECADAHQPAVLAGGSGVGLPLGHGGRMRKV